MVSVLLTALLMLPAPRVDADSGASALTALGLEAPAHAPRFARLALETVGEDVLETLGRAA